MTKFKDLPVGAMAFVGPVLMRKTGNTKAIAGIMGWTEQEVDPEKEIELMKSVVIKGHNGSSFKQTYGGK